MSLWTIKEVTRKLGVSESALRYYNSKGILSPTKQEESGRRQWLYDDNEIEQLRKLILLQYIGIPMSAAKGALADEETFRNAVSNSLERMLAERERLSKRIFVAEVLELSWKAPAIMPDEDMNEAKAAVIIEQLKELVMGTAK